MDAPITPATMKYQGVGKRFVAVVVDTVLLFIVGWVLAAATGNTTSAGDSMDGGPAFLLFAIWILYYILMEAYVGGTVGKLVLGMRVVKVDGSPCDIQSSLIRNVLRIIYGLFVYLVGAILVWTSDKRQRLGDRAANTVVVSKS